MKGKGRQRFADLTDDGGNYAGWQEEGLLCHLQKKLGKSQHEISEMLNTL